MTKGLGLILLIVIYEIAETYLRYALGRWLAGWRKRNSAWCRAAIRSRSAAACWKARLRRLR